MCLDNVVGLTGLTVESPSLQGRGGHSFHETATRWMCVQKEPRITNSMEQSPS
jgi:hypothetical protein